MSKRFTLFLFALITIVLIFGVPTIFGQYKGTAVTMEALLGGAHPARAEDVDAAAADV